MDVVKHWLRVGMVKDKKIVIEAVLFFRDRRTMFSIKLSLS